MIQATKSSAPNAARSGCGPRDTGPVASGGPEFFAGPASFGPGEEGPELRAREAGVISLADCGRSFLSDPITLLLSIGREGTHRGGHPVPCAPVVSRRNGDKPRRKRALGFTSSYFPDPE